MASNDGEIIMPGGEGEQTTSPTKLSDAQRAHIERKRQKALLLRQSRLASRPYPPTNSQAGTKNHVAPPPRLIDRGGGFLVEESQEQQDKSQTKVHHPPGAVLDTGFDGLHCDECGKDFLESYLHTHFEALVCDKCRDTEEKHRLTTKTEAKNMYLLKDADFDMRDPPLKFILRKNPRNNHWGDMKLFLEAQVAERALEVWGSEEKMEEERERRSENKEKGRQKRFDKKIKELRKAVRSSMWTKTASVHEHEYGEENYNEEEDEYYKTCSTCGHTMSYEKM